MTSPPAPENLKPRNSPKLLAGIILALGTAAVLLTLFSHRGLYNMYRLRQEALRLEQENIRLAADNENLTRTIDRLQHDPDFIQDRIRRDLNFVKQNELIFQFPPEGQEHTRSAPPGTPENVPVSRIEARPDSREKLGTGGKGRGGDGKKNHRTKTD